MNASVEKFTLLDVIRLAACRGGLGRVTGRMTTPASPTYASQASVAANWPRNRLIVSVETSGSTRAKLSPAVYTAKPATRHWRRHHRHSPESIRALGRALSDLRLVLESETALKRGCTTGIRVGTVSPCARSRKVAGVMRGSRPLPALEKFGSPDQSSCGLPGGRGSRHERAHRTGRRRQGDGACSPAAARRRAVRPG